MNLLKAMLLIALLTTGAWADSLLPEGHPDLYKAVCLQAGDLVTIVITDRVTTTQSVDLKSQDKSQAGGPLVQLLSAAILGIAPQHEDSADRKEAASSVSQFQDTVTATVTEVKGNVLTLQASRVVQLDGKTRTLTLQGQVRNQDVNPDNTVSSSLLANSVVKVDGLHQSPVEPGILTRILRVLF